MWQGQQDESGQWRVFSQFMRFLGNFGGNAPKAIAPISPDEPIKLRVRVRHQENRKFIYPAVHQETVGDLKRSLSALTGQHVLTVFEGDYELFDSLKIGHVLRSEDEIEVVVAGKNSTKVHAPQLNLPVVQEGLIKRPPEISHKLELNKPSVRKQSEQSNQSKVQKMQTEGALFTNGTPMKATNQFESNQMPVLDASFHEPMSTQANTLGESGHPKKKRGRPPKKTESPKSDAVKDNIEPMRQELVTDKIVHRMGDDEPISLAGDNLTHGAHTDINTHTEVTPLKEKAAEIKLEHPAQSIKEGNPQLSQEKHQTSHEKPQDTKQKNKDGLKKAHEILEQPKFSQEKPQSSQEEPHKIQNKAEAEQDIPQVSQDKNDEPKQEKKQKKKDKKKAERELAEAKKKEEEAEAERKLSMERQTRNKTAKNQALLTKDGFLDGLGKEKINTLGITNGKEPMTRRRKQKIGDGDELIFGVIDHLETDSEGRSPAKFASPKEKKELEKVQKNKKLPKVVETPEKKPEPMTTELLEPSTEDKKVIEVQQKVINKRINLNDDSESSESEDCKVKAIKPKSHMTGKQSTETVFKSVISGGSEMERILKKQQAKKQVVQSEESSDEQASPIKIPKSVAERKISEHVDRDKSKQTTTAHVVKATIKIQKGESDSSESSDSDVPAKKPIKVFKKQAAAPKQNVESASDSESDKEDKKKSAIFHKYDQKNNIFKNNKLNRGS